MRFRIETWGCQMNEHDSERMAGLLAAQGMTPADHEAEADVILLNTCAIREKASQKVFGRLGVLRAAKIRRPDLVIGVCGCVAQLEQREIFRRAPHVDFVMGPRAIPSLRRLVEDSRTRRRHQLAVSDPRDRLDPEAHEIALRSSRTRAFITVMEGCNKTCTFCVVPMTRGREACRTPDSILEESARAVAEGFPEIELLGQNVNAYRSGTTDFAALLGLVGDVPGLARLRFTTSHPLHFRQSIADRMADNPVICPFLHLPVQSGADAVLERMRRGYTVAGFRRKVEGARTRVPGLALSTDIIVGFPGETDPEFQSTLDLVRATRFDQIYAFVYSPRPGTPAAEYADDIPLAEKESRLRVLQSMQAEIQREIHAELVDREVEVLVEGPSLLDPHVLAGRTATSKIVNFTGPVEWTGRLVRVRILRASANSFRGEAIERAPSLTSSGGRDIYETILPPSGGLAT
ncbi:MAG: tRNA (N6-isopentenyl adenosine(37)-C2)-methylthiotransferase MiaB [Acidobacteria bacterium]|nr:tRNA (N6-isopentenyl adenosine(37)-C2)-methylthiotransferase MiaB [Acidobacteriota bacterium]